MPRDKAWKPFSRLRDCAAAGSGVVMATHDARAVARADTVLHLHRGVLSGTRDVGQTHSTAIDPLGRIQLPDHVLPLFPEGRAVVTVHDGHVELHPPGEGS